MEDTLELEHEVELLVSDRAKIGEVEGAGRGAVFGRAAAVERRPA